MHLPTRGILDANNASHVQYLTALALDPEICVGCFRDDYDIDGVYSYSKEPISPFIRLDNLDLAKLLDLRSFWQRHLLNSTEGTFHESFGRLAETLKPKAQNVDISSPMSLSTSWLGYYCEFGQKKRSLLFSPHAEFSNSLCSSVAQFIG